MNGGTASADLTGTPELVARPGTRRPRRSRALRRALATLVPTRFLHPGPAVYTLHRESNDFWYDGYGGELIALVG